MSTCFGSSISHCANATCRNSSTKQRMPRQLQWQLQALQQQRQQQQVVVQQLPAAVEAMQRQQQLAARRAKPPKWKAVSAAELTWACCRLLCRCRLQSNTLQHFAGVAERSVSCHMRCMHVAQARPPAKAQVPPLLLHGQVQVLLVVMQASLWSWVMIPS